LGVEIRFSSKVGEVVIEEGRVAGVRLVGNNTSEDEDGFIPTQHVSLPSHLVHVTPLNLEYTE
jgi:phytoene dehydrogenase-like protein